MENFIHGKHQSLTSYRSNQPSWLNELLFKHSRASTVIFTQLLNPLIPILTSQFSMPLIRLSFMQTQISLLKLLISNNPKSLNHTSQTKTSLSLQLLKPIQHGSISRLHVRPHKSLNSSPLCKSRRHLNI